MNLSFPRAAPGIPHVTKTAGGFPYLHLTPLGLLPVTIPAQSPMSHCSANPLLSHRLQKRSKDLGL